MIDLLEALFFENRNRFAFYSQFRFLELRLKYSNLPGRIAFRPDAGFHVNFHRCVGEQMIFAVVHVDHDVGRTGAFSGYLNVAIFQSFHRRYFAVGRSDRDESGFATGQLYADLIGSARRHLITSGIKHNGIADASNHTIIEMLGGKAVPLGKETGSIVFASKYRRKVAYGNIRIKIEKILRELCTWKQVEIVEAEVCPDRIHMLVKIPPKMSVSGFVGFLKGESTLLIFER